jgi:ectoine hydroxylase-related dioxygenase (phytanoyl-CoA dioxygenase family)
MLQRLPGLLPAATAARWRAVLAQLPGGSLRLADAMDIAAMLPALHTLQDAVQRRLGAAPQLVLSQCWVRRAQAPHQWHQDGALNHDFIADGGGLPLPMLTAWIALTDCGVDAPGLEWRLPSLTHLLLPAELGDAEVRRRFAAGCFEHPALAAGDAVLFDGGLLHRTHTTPAMTQPRTSIELRCIAAGAVPDRLRGENLLAWPAPP